MIRIIGCGFSGLTLAYYLRKKGIEVELLEKKNEVGGLIHTYHHAFGIAETAANAFIWSPRLNALCKHLGVELFFPRKAAKKRYVFKNAEARRWPLSFWASLRLFGTFIKILLLKPQWARPQNGESVSRYIQRVFSAEVLSNLVAPALQGIYAGDVEKMSARLIFGRFLDANIPDIHGLDFSKQKKAKKGSVSPAQGMGQLILALENHLRAQGVKIIKKVERVELRPGDVIATSAWDAVDLLKPQYPETAKNLEAIESLGLISVTQFYSEQTVQLQGFGCLFPRGEGVRALGVLMNSVIFEGRSNLPSETWILGGALDPELLNCTDAEIRDIVSQDREALYGSRGEVLECQITRWPRALPHYSLKHEEVLETLELPAGVYLHGNYLGRIGLSQILDRSELLAEKIIKDINS